MINNPDRKHAHKSCTAFEEVLQILAWREHHVYGMFMVDFGNLPS